MLYEVLSNKEFALMMKRHASEIMGFLFDNNYHFSILANTADITFDPPLPQEITQNFQQVILFALAGYTYESAKMDEKNLYFEAGFGAENIGSIVTVPISSILQIIVEDNPIFINLSYPYEEEEDREDEEGLEKSMKIFASNPENEKLLKKKKKK
ncbi:MAG: hypothetical protein GXO31_03745 [Epsilonproteobacteria bacterium]|nr:hypothetical protein [Campylobacterota bacterium]